MVDAKRMDPKRLQKLFVQHWFWGEKEGGNFMRDFESDCIYLKVIARCHSFDKAGLFEYQVVPKKNSVVKNRLSLLDVRQVLFF